MPYFNIVAETNQNTVVTEYEPVRARADSYQSEAALEQEFIRLLGEQGYQYLPIHNEADLIRNLRERLEELNKYSFTDSEWDRFLKESLANPNDHIVEKTRKIQEDNVQVLKRDTGETKNITIIDRKNCRAQAPGRRYPRGLQPDRALSAGLLLGGQRPVRICPDLRYLERHQYQVLFQQHAAQRHPGRRKPEYQEGEDQQQL